MESVVYIDTNIVLEFKPLAEWDWSLLELEHPTVVVCKTVVRELDKNKTNRSKGKRNRAKAFLDVLESVPANDKLELPSYALQLYLRETSDRENADLLLNPKTPDEFLIASIKQKYRHDDPEHDRFLLSDDYVLRLSAKHELRNQKVKPIKPPPQYRITERNDEMSNSQATAKELLRLLLEAAGQHPSK